jgi:Helix-turn-helix domain
MSERTAIRAVAALERAGLISIERSEGRGRPNRFTLIKGGRGPDAERRTHSGRDPELPANAFKVASVLADHLNRKSRMAWPDQATIADLAGLSESAVKRMIAALRRHGYLDLVSGGGAGHSSRYRFIDEKGFISEPVSAAEKGSDRAAKRGSKSEKKGFSSEPRPYEGGSNEPPDLRERECAQARATPRTGARPSDGPAPVRKAEPATDRPGGKVEGGARERTGRQPEGFTELRQLWRRPWPDDDDAEALAAFTAATRSGVRAGKILAAAKAWVTDADSPRFLPSLTKWLAGRSWERPPPGRDRPRPDKAAKAGQSAPRNGGKVDLARMALAQGRAIKEGRAGL